MAATDEETLVSLTPEQALSGQRLELELRDGTLVEVWTPPWRGMAGACGWPAWRPAAPITSCSCGCGPKRDCASMACGCFTSSISTRPTRPLAARRWCPPSRGPCGCGCLPVPPAAGSCAEAAGPEPGEQRGDQLVEVRIVVPAKPTEAEEALFRRLRELDLEQNSANDA